MAHLGYSSYFMTILGVWYVLAGLALLAPRSPRLKEWAYAGLIFNYSGAAASHLFVGDGASRWSGPVIFAAFTLGSWALRPSDRRLGTEGSTGSLRPAAWIFPLSLVVLLLVLSLLTLSKGPPPA
jgi:hypothetical protein